MADASSKTPKPAKGKKNYLDSTYMPGDTIPAPEVVEGTGDSAWAEWSEASQAHERKFADTEPASAPMVLSPEERGWANTQPADALDPLAKPVRRPRVAAPEPPALTVDLAMVVARRNNRVCPRPLQWDEFTYLLSTAGQRAKVRTPPPMPATGASWSATPPLTKRLCFREQIEWAGEHGVLADVMRFIEELPENAWLHMGDEK